MKKAETFLPLILAIAILAYAFSPAAPVPSDVPNEYGVGLVAYRKAPKDGKADEVASIYAKSADFLYGVPTLKFIVSSNSPDNDDPNRSVLAWQDQEIPAGWGGWLEDVREAFAKSQERSQFKRSDWRDAFIEVSKALEAVE